MQWKSAFATAVSAIVLVLPVHARIGVQEATLWFRADISLDPGGRVASLSWRNYKPMPAAVRESLEEEIRDWEFRPMPGVRVVDSIETTITVQVLATERRDGKFGVEVEEAFTGASLLDVPDEHGWQRWERRDGGQRPRSVEIVYDVDWGNDGAQRIELREFEASTSRREYREAQELRAQEQIRAWQVRPEKVDGTPVDARFRYLYAHCVVPAWCAGNDSRGFRDLPEVPRGDPVPLSSVVTLVTPVHGLEL